MCGILGVTPAEMVGADMYTFIDANKAAFSVLLMCACLGVSRSGFYEWLTREDSPTAQRRSKLLILIKKAFADSDGTYGYRRVHEQLVRWGHPVSLELVRRLMRAADLRPCQPRPWRPTTTIAGDAAGIPDLVRRDFTAHRPGIKLIGDITYVRTWQGWLYLALVIDCYSKMIVGWAMDDNYKTPLIQSAIRMAARNLALPTGAIFHSDRGSNYTSEDFAKTLRDLGLRQSVGRTGICYDNAMAESVNGAVKVELVNRAEYATRDAARREIARYIELYYNTRRFHSGLGYRTPREVMDEYHRMQAGA